MIHAIHAALPAARFMRAPKPQPTSYSTRHHAQNDRFERSQTSAPLKFGLYQIQPRKITSDEALGKKAYPELEYTPFRVIAKLPKNTPDVVQTWLDAPLALFRSKPNLSNLPTYASPKNKATVESAVLQQQVWDQQVLNTLVNFSYLINTDGLTGLWNKAFFDRELSNKVSTANGKPVALALLDMNDFKLINEAFGHDFGDKALQIFAKALQKSIPKGAYACRTGGDEFGILFPNGTKKEIGRQTFQKLQRRLRQEQYQVQDGPLKIYLSCSYAFSRPENVTDSQLVYKNTDKLLASVKTQKGNIEAFQKLAEALPDLQSSERDKKRKAQETARSVLTNPMRSISNLS